jgi:hypothetical protein
VFVQIVFLTALNCAIKNSQRSQNLPGQSRMTELEILASYKDAFVSHEISDADPFEKSTKSFTPWFTKLTYPFIQPNFDACFAIVHSITSHYRPPVQKCGALCLFTLVTEAAPAQIRRVSASIRETLDKLVQIGHCEVLIEVLPVVAKATPILYDNASIPEFHTFFMNYLETWNRDATDATASFEYAKWFREMTPFLGMCAARYIRPTIAIVTKRLQYCNSRAHILQYLATIDALCHAAWPVIGANSPEVGAILKKARENGAEFPAVNEQCRGVEELLAGAPRPPVFPE